MKKDSIYHLNALEYFADFFIVPICVMFIMHYNTETIGFMISMVVVGAVSWTFAEYWLHRYVLHGKGTFGTQHTEHHMRPKALIGNPPWLTVVSMLGLLGFTWVISNYDFASAFTAGVLCGYLIYAAIHVNLHHRAPEEYGPTMARLYEHHKGHHRGGQYNYGVTVDWWDRVFKTKN